jgi:hypothetical protein
VLRCCCSPLLQHALAWRHHKRPHWTSQCQRWLRGAR